MHELVGDGACNDLLVEGPEVLEGSPTPGQDQDVTFPALVCQPYGCANARRRPFTLHGDGINKHRDGREATAQDAEDIAHGGAGRRGDDADTPWQGRQCLFRLRREQAFRVQFAFEFLEGALQRTVAGFLHVLHDELVIAARFVQADPGAHQHLHAFLRPEAQRPAAVAKQGPADLGVGILETEIEMA